MARTVARFTFRSRLASAAAALLLGWGVPAAPVAAQTVPDAAVGSEVTIALIGGDIVSGTVLEAHDDRLVLSHPVFGMLTVPALEIAPPPEPEPEPEVSPWSGVFDVSESGARGNSDNNKTRVSLEFLFDDEETTRDRIYARYRKDEEDGDDTTDNSLVQLRREWYLETSKWRPFVQGSMEWDDFTDWERQQTVGAGGAYPILDEEAVELVGRIGLASNRKLAGSEEDEGWQLEALLGGDWCWDISDEQRFRANMDIYPSLENGGEYRANTNLTYEHDLGEDESPWRLRMGIDHRYESEPGDDTRTWDYDYFVGLGYSF